MKNIILAVLLLSSFLAVSAKAADKPAQVGISFGTDGALGIHGEFDISSRADNAPVSAQVFLKNAAYNESYNVTWNTNAIGGAAIYDFNTRYKLDNKIHPYAGIGLMYVDHNWTGISSEVEYSGVDSGFYVTGGVRYSLSPSVAFDFSYNNFGGFTAGLNLTL